MSSLNPKQVLIVGAGGFIGSNVLNRFVIDNFKVRAMDLFLPRSLDNRVEWIIGSSNDETLFAKAAQGCDIVVYLAGGSLPASGNANMSAEIDSHVKGTIKSAEICRDLGVERFIFASSGGAVYGSSLERPLQENDPTIPLNAYGVSKLAIENYLRIMSKLYNIQVVSLRISNPYGVGQRANKSQGFVAAAFAAAIQGTTLHIWGDGSVVRDFVYIDDVARAFSKACNYSGKSSIINIGSGVGKSLSDVIKVIESTVGKPINIEYNYNRVIDASKNVLDVSLAKDLLEWEPEISIEKGIIDTYHWWKSTKDI